MVGINKLNNIIKVICSRAGLVGNCTNHSGKRTCATQLYMAGVDEQEIMRRTGHRSEKSVRNYKQPSRENQKQVASVLDPLQPSSTVSGDDSAEKCLWPTKLLETELCDFEPSFDTLPRIHLQVGEIGNRPYFAFNVK